MNTDMEGYIYILKYSLLQMYICLVDQDACTRKILWHINCLTGAAVVHYGFFL